MILDKLGNYIRYVDQRNQELQHENVKGISNKKIFIDTKANMNGVPLHNYKTVKNNMFAFVTVTSRNGEKLSIALNRTQNIYIVSSTYIVFETTEKVLPEFLYIYFNRPEFDRYVRFNSWGSARETFGWEDLCGMEIPILAIEEQRKYVALYDSLLNNQSCYQNSIEDLQLICDNYIENLIKTESKKKLGEYIQRLTRKNGYNKYNSVIGISEKKEFRLPSGKVNKENLSNHYIVSKCEFAYIPRMNPSKPLAIALSNFENPVLVSPSYNAFRIKEKKILMPEYLMLYFSRSEFDRYAAFNAWSSTRDTFDWGDLCDVMLPVPSLEKQEAIVKIYHTLETRKKINEILKESLQPLCPVLMRGILDDIANNVKN